MSIYNFEAEKINGRKVSLDEYKGKAMIIVNTASKCGFTPQYEDLEKIYKEYKDKGLAILGFPSNQFAEQEPGSNKDIAGFCQLNYGVTFDLFAKGDVRGNDAHPVFKYLTDSKPFEGFNLDNPSGKMLNMYLSENFPEFLTDNDIKWNFTKFLIDKEGKVLKRFEPTDSPLDMIPYIEEIL